MKTTLLKISFIFLFLSLMGAGCEKDDELLWEISPDSETAVIQKEVDGIEFKFCLLNEQGEPATVFNEGENFTFQFAIKNNRTESLPFYDYGYYELDDFLAVKSDGEHYGQPFRFKAYNPTKELRWLLSGDYYSYNFMVPWHDERDEWQLLWGFFESARQPYLEKGTYHTQFAYKFSFGMSNKEPELETGLITFKINFEIK